MFLFNKFPVYQVDLSGQGYKNGQTAKKTEMEGPLCIQLLRGRKSGRKASVGSGGRAGGRPERGEEEKEERKMEMKR